ncbi:MAG: SAM-dependent methyltransferase [Longimicrobiales bacterium]|nr:SAM-dependent methyltransferase [Longimicrobiales bacterium]
MTSRSGGSLVVAGVGMTFLSHLTAEVRGEIEGADDVFLVVANPAMADWVRRANPRVTPLDMYREQEPGLDSAAEWQRQIDVAIERTLAPARTGRRVCVVLDGHPAVSVDPVHRLVGQAEREGIPTRFLPGISAEDCLFADLAIDPARDGCQSFEATDFLLRRRPFSESSGLLLRQIGLIGEFMLLGRRNDHGLHVLTDTLLERYPATHPVVLYEAALLPVGGARLERIALADLPGAGVTDFSTLYVPPCARRSVDPAMAKRLGIPPERIRP